MDGLPPAMGGTFSTKVPIAQFEGLFHMFSHTHTAAPQFLESDKHNPLAKVLGSSTGFRRANSSHYPNYSTMNLFSNMNIFLVRDIRLLIRKS